VQGGSLTRGRAKARASIYTPQDQAEIPKETFENAIKRCKALKQDSTSPWFNAEILYHVEVRQRPRIVHMAHDAAAKTTDRHLAIIRKKNQVTGTSTVMYLAQILIRGAGGDVDIKHAFELSGLKAIDSIDDRTDDEVIAEHEVVFVFPQLDVALYFDSNRAKEECTWVLVKVCRGAYSVDVSYDYKLDLDSVGYTFITSGQLTLFPLLSKVGIGSTVGDMFAEEEIEADQVMTELAWGAHQDFSYLSTEELLLALEKQSTSLQCEIIDFLLKWEEDDGSGNVVAGINRMSLAPLNTGTTSKASTTTAKESFDVLDALNSVDSDLEGVDGWLGDQIDQLNSIQSKLFLIESESGSLETSYSNLSSVQQIVDELINALQIDEEAEQYLRSPMSIVQRVINSPLLDDVDSMLSPLVSAMLGLQAALKTKGQEVADGHSITVTTWTALQNMSAIALQRGKLLDLSDTCNAAVANNSGYIFDSVLKHKSLGKKSKNSVLVTFVLNEILASNIGTYNDTRNYAIGNDPSKNQMLFAQRNYHGALSDFLPMLEAVLEFSKYQPVGGTHRESQTYSNDINAWNKSILANYVKSIEGGFYSPLIRQLFSDLNAMVKTRPAILNLRSMKGYYPAKGKSAWSGEGTIMDQIVEKDKDLQQFRLAQTSVNYQNPTVSPWEALELSLILLAPVITREEGFFQSIFHCDSKNIGSDRNHSGEVVLPLVATDPEGHVSDSGENGKTARELWGTVFNGIRVMRKSVAINSDRKNYLLSTAETKLNIIFQEFPLSVGKLVKFNEASFFLSLLSVKDEVDGMEAMAMLVTLQNYMIRSKIPHVPPVINQEDVLSGTEAPGQGLDAFKMEAEKADTNTEYSLFLASLLYRIRSVLISKVKIYLDQNIAWLESQIADPKHAGVLSPMTKLPSMLACIFNITSKLLLETTIPCIDEFVFVMTREVLKWVMKVSEMNDKYRDVVLMHNLSYFEEVVGAFAKGNYGVCGVRLTIVNLKPFMNFAGESRRAAESAYIRWMLSYEVPDLASITSRMEGLGDRVKLEELALYVRRKDVLSVINGLDARTLEHAIASMKQRMRKHCAADAAEEVLYDGQTLCQRTWESLGSCMEEVLVKLAESAQASYQISLLVPPQTVKAMFGKADR